jgi:hypothetical protein
MNEISDIPEHVLIIGAITLALLILSIPVVLMTLRKKSAENIEQNKLGPKGHFILSSITTVLIYIGAYFILIEQYPKISESNISLSLFITEIAFVLFWSGYMGYLAIKMLKNGKNT